MNLPRVFRNRIRSRKSLKAHTSFRIGGTAQYWYEPKDTAELIRFLKIPNIPLPLFVIGAGSNLLIKDGLVKKIFIHLNSPHFNKIEVKGTDVIVGAGVKINRLIPVLGSKNLGGYEFLAGIPGTIGGVMIMNAGAKSDLRRVESYREMKDIVSEVQGLDRKGNLIRFKKDDIKFSYRNSSLRPYIITRVRLKLEVADKRQVRSRIREIIKIRLKNQDWQYPNAGCFFKNPQNAEPAGRLIDLCRLKGVRVGGAQVSERHGNFIINVKRAKSSDVIRLMEIVAKKVYNQFKIKLKPEVEIVS